MAVYQTERPVYVIGHQNPDTDSVCSALAYAWLKNQGSETKYEAFRAGALNRETEFVLSHLGVRAPSLCTDVSPQVRDMEIRQEPGIDPETSLRAAWSMMRDAEIESLSVIDPEGRLLGVIAVKNIANANMDLLDTNILAAANTSYQNLLSTLEGELLVGDPREQVRGQLHIGTSPEAMEGVIGPGDVVLTSNRYEVQLCAIESGAGCIVVCCGSAVPATILSYARDKGCAVMTTHFDTYAAARLASTAAPVRHLMIKDKVIYFSLSTPLEEVQKVMASVRIQYFPVLDDQGRYCGMISRRNFLNLRRKQVILVDHNERTQAVEGIEEADILEIIDHHRIGALETNGPVYFRNVPVGCTCTIIYQMYLENGVEPDPAAAGLMLSAILSDTLMFRSPTCTPIDQSAAQALARIAGVELEAYADAMFEAGGDVSGKTAEEIFNGDYKVFTCGDVRFGVGQGNYMSDKNRRASEALVGPYLEKALSKQRLDYVFYMFTDVRAAASELLMAGRGAEAVIARAFGVEAGGGMALLPGVVSRKKQLIPALMKALKALEQEA